MNRIEDLGRSWRKVWNWFRNYAGKTSSNGPNEADSTIELQSPGATGLSPPTRDFPKRVLNLSTVLEQSDSGVSRYSCEPIHAAVPKEATSEKPTFAAERQNGGTLAPVNIIASHELRDFQSEPDSFRSESAPRSVDNSSQCLYSSETIRGRGVLRQDDTKASEAPSTQLREDQRKPSSVSPSEAYKPSARDLIDAYESEAKRYWQLASELPAANARPQSRNYLSNLAKTPNPDDALQVTVWERAHELFEVCYGLYLEVFTVEELFEVFHAEEAMEESSEEDDSDTDSVAEHEANDLTARLNRKVKEYIEDPDDANFFLLTAGETNREERLSGFLSLVDHELLFGWIKSLWGKWSESIKSKGVADSVSISRQSSSSLSAVSLTSDYSNDTSSTVEAKSIAGVRMGTILSAEGEVSQIELAGNGRKLKRSRARNRSKSPVYAMVRDKGQRRFDNCGAAREMSLSASEASEKSANLVSADHWTLEIPQHELSTDGIELEQPRIACSRSDFRSTCGALSVHAYFQVELNTKEGLWCKTHYLDSGIIGVAAALYISKQPKRMFSDTKIMWEPGVSIFEIIGVIWI